MKGKTEKTLVATVFGILLFVSLDRDANGYVVLYLTVLDRLLRYYPWPHIRLMRLQRNRRPRAIRIIRAVRIQRGGILSVGNSERLRP